MSAWKLRREASGYGKFIHADGDIYEARDVVLDLVPRRGIGKMTKRMAMGGAPKVNLYGSHSGPYLFMSFRFSKTK